MVHRCYKCGCVMAITSDEEGHARETVRCCANTGGVAPCCDCCAGLADAESNDDDDGDDGY